MPYSSLVAAIRNIDYCAHLPPETLASFARSCRVHKPPTSVPLRLPCPQHSVALIVSGAARQVETDAQGASSVRRIVVRGDILGSLRDTDAEPFVIHLLPSRVDLLLAIVPRRDLLSLLLSCPRSATLLLLHVDSRRQLMEGQFQRLQHLPVDVRVAAVLTDLLVLCRCQDLQSSVIPIDLRQSDLGDLAGASRQATNRVIRSLYAEGLVEQCGCRFFVNNIPALFRLASAKTAVSRVN